MVGKQRESGSQKKVLPVDDSAYAREQLAMKEFVALLNTAGRDGRRGRLK